MLSGVLRSKRAVAVNIAIMRAFVELRRAATSYAAIEKRLEELERDTRTKLGQHDQQLADVFEALRQLISPPPRPKRRVGFTPPEDEWARTTETPPARRRSHLVLRVSHRPRPWPSLPHQPESGSTATLKQCCS